MSYQDISSTSLLQMEFALHIWHTGNKANPKSKDAMFSEKWAEPVYRRHLGNFGKVRGNGAGLFALQQHLVSMAW